ncbi:MULTISPECIES: helix-turn-helix domain-containing protein [Cytobacillus]|uniref:helix-turn-helix domain-containing protein n=1 Tax=Cytobacillus TaxID=2675230 RepID=UPI0025A2A0B4|nr:helix-turn-helix transcriptional regulator [Cytobacillus kochii]MDM5208446.1 helix-turn-helix transcriptional regulator [Cytobacillus kochii]
MSKLIYIVGRCLLGELIKERKMTQTELANLLGVTPQQINKYVHNTQKMSLQVAINIGHILKCDIEDLYEIHPVGKRE